MSDNFKQTFESFKQEQENLNRRMAEAKREAVMHVQEIIDVFGIRPSDLRFPIEGVAIHRTRTPAAIKYRTPNGITWTGKGRVKKEFLEYLNEQGETLADLDKYRVDLLKQEVKEEPKAEPTKEEQPKLDPKEIDKDGKHKARPLFHKN